MALRIAIVGPGRVGTAFAHRLTAAGATVLGFVGRDVGRARRAVDALGCGAVLSPADLQRAHVVVFAVGDPDLRPAVAEAAGHGARSCSLWLHTSGCHGLDVFDPALPHGIRVGSLHPLLPLAGGDASRSFATGLALLSAGERSERLLRRLCRLLGFEAIVAGAQDRVRYHAACALAANGTTALFAAAEQLLDDAGGLVAGDARRIVAALAEAAVASSARHGAGKALSGPVRRGDADTVAAHLARIGGAHGDARAVYVASMRLALQLAREQGLGDEAAARLAAVLAQPPAGPA